MVAAWVGAKTNLDEVVIEVILLVIYTHVWRVSAATVCACVHPRGCGPAQTAACINS